MIRLLWKILVFLGSSAVGILVATMLLDDMHVEPAGFVIAVVIYSVVQAVVQPFVTKMALRYASAFMGGTALVATLVALIVTALIGDSLQIDGGATWIAATVIVWLFTAIASLVLPFLLVKAGIEHLRDGDDEARPGIR